MHYIISSTINIKLADSLAVHYKYITPKTKVLLHNGSCVFGEDLNLGDVLLSPIPNAKVIVGSIHPFQSQNYMIIPRFCNTPFLVNENTLLPIKHENSYLFISIQRYQQLTNKNNIGLVHEPADFTQYPIKIDPYILGIWFNHNRRTSNLIILPKTTVTVIFYIQAFLDKFNVQHTDHDDCVIITDKRILHYMKLYNLTSSSSYPKIPTPFMYNVRPVREKFLAGFIDNNITDQILIVDEQLKDDILFIAHSLGHLTITKYKDKMWYVTITYTNNEIDLNPCNNDFKVAKIPYQDALCVGLVGGPMSSAIYLSDFTAL